jgi:hypothetical protein
VGVDGVARGDCEACARQTSRYSDGAQTLSQRCVVGSQTCPAGSGVQTASSVSARAKASLGQHTPPSSTVLHIMVANVKATRHLPAW